MVAQILVYTFFKSQRDDIIIEKFVACNLNPEGVTLFGVSNKLF